MKGKVIKLFEEEEPVNENLVEGLRHMLKLAKKGELKYILCAAKINDSDFSYLYAGMTQDQILEIIGFLETLKTNLIEVSGDF